LFWQSLGINKRRCLTGKLKSGLGPFENANRIFLDKTKNAAPQDFSFRKPAIMFHILYQQLSNNLMFLFYEVKIHVF
jgi:hypothetical protein